MSPRGNSQFHRTHWHRDRFLSSAPLIESLQDTCISAAWSNWPLLQAATRVTASTFGLLFLLWQDGDAVDFDPNVRTQTCSDRGAGREGVCEEFAVGCVDFSPVIVAADVHAYGHEVGQLSARCLDDGSQVCQRLPGLIAGVRAYELTGDGVEPALPSQIEVIFPTRTPWE